MVESLGKLARSGAVLALPWVALWLIGCGSHDGKPRGPFRMRDTPTNVQVTPLVAIESARWPLAAPISVALAPDGKQFAYTTAGGELHVRSLTGGDAKRWNTAPITGAITLYVAGFYSDGSLAVLSTTSANEWRLHRVTAAGGAALVHSAPSRMFAAVSPVGDRTIVATETTISELTPTGARQIAAAPAGDRIVAIAISPDGTRIANMRDVANEATEQIHVTTMDGAALGWQQRFGSSPGHGHELLAWIDNERFVYAGGDSANESGKTEIYCEGLDDGLPETRALWPVDAHVGLGSAANGILLVVRAPPVKDVQLAGTAAWPLASVGAGTTRVIGWTRDHRPVLASGFWREERVMRGDRPWPGTKAGDEGDAIAGDDVILHRFDTNGIVVERLDAAGSRIPLGRVSMANARWRPQLVRCAGESAAPCMIEHVEYDHTSWIAFDPITGERGEELYRHTISQTNGPTPNAALSPDGKTLAVVDESATVTLVIDKTAHAVRLEGVGAIDSITFATNDELWASARDVRGRPFAVLHLALDRQAMQLRFDDATLPADDALRVYMRPTPSRDRGKLAVGVRELRTEIVRVVGL